MSPRYSIWYYTNPDGSCVAKCPTWRGWQVTAPTFVEARRLAEPSLRAWMSDYAEFHHFKPVALPEVAA